jgi:hypothetical protein
LSDEIDEDSTRPDDTNPPSVGEPIPGMNPPKRKRGRPPTPSTDDEIRAALKRFHVDVVTGKRPSRPFEQQQSARWLSDQLEGRPTVPAPKPVEHDEADMRKALVEELHAIERRERPATDIVQEDYGLGSRTDADGGVVTSVGDLAEIRKFDLEHGLTTKVNGSANGSDNPDVVELGRGFTARRRVDGKWRVYGPNARLEGDWICLKPTLEAARKWFAERSDND